MFAVPAFERRLAVIVVVSMAGLPVALFGVDVYNVGSEVVELPATHCTTEHAEKLVAGDGLASISKANAALPAGAVVGFGDGGIGGTALGFPAYKAMVGCGKVGVLLEIVNCSVLDAPAELETVTTAGFGTTVSLAKIVAVSCVGLTIVGMCCAPFQFTTESLVNPVPVTVKVKSVVFPQNGAKLGESDVMEGGVPSAALIVKGIMFDTAVVTVVLTFCVGDCAEPGISTATCTTPVLVRSEAGTGAVNSIELTSVVVSGVPFHKIKAPVEKPWPLAVMRKPWLPTWPELGLMKVRTEEAVWTERLVL